MKRDPSIAGLPTDGAAAHAGGPTTTGAPASRGYFLLVLTLIFAFNYVDRIALGIMLQDIKADLKLTDTQLGLLTGIAFSLFYAAMGVPLARWADRGNRVTIISLTVGLWSAAVALCGMAGSFAHLMLLRIGVAVGEAGCQPPALSLISDYYGRKERTRAISRYKLGWPLALIIGNLSAGWLNELFGWRTTFVILGLPGLLLALLALSLREPRRKAAAHAEAPASPSLRKVAAALWGNATYRQLALCMLLTNFFTYGIVQWQPAFFVRSHGLETGELGTWLAIFYGGGTLLGTWVGGELMHRFAADNERLQMLLLTGLYIFFGVLWAAVYLAPTYQLAFVCLGLAVLGGGATNGPLYAATQTLVSPQMRAMSVAVVMFFSHLIGNGLGPLVAGGLSDLLRPSLGEESLRYALVALCPGYLWCAWCLWKASKTASHDVALAEAAEARA